MIIIAKSCCACTWLTANPIKELWFDSDWFLHDKDNVHWNSKKNTTKRYKLRHWIPP